MIKQDPFDSLTFLQIYNITKKKAKEFLPKGSTNPTVELEL